ncbi:MAG: sensory box protein [uncultured bacterium]|nr:MAG: sensory box protein [uncultured bacterium]HLD43938.1 PAS domain S-box protein [bacterium]
MNPSFKRPFTALGFFVILAVSLFIAEFIVMLSLSGIHHELLPVAEALIDALLLIFVLSPVLYFFAIKPLTDQIRLRYKSEMALMQQNKTFQKVNDILEQSLLTENHTELARIFLQITNEQTSSDFGFIGLITEKQTLNIIATSDPALAKINPERFTELPVSDEWMSPLLDNKTLLVNHQKDCRVVLGLPSWHPEITSFLSTTLRLKDGLVGIICLAKKKFPFSGNDTSFIEALSPFFATAIHRKLLETKIKENEERLRTVTMTALDAIIIMDENGCITGWNPAATRMFGYPLDEILGKNLHTVLSPSRYWADYEKNIPHFRKTGQGPIVRKTREIVALRKDGTEFPIELSVSAIPFKDKWGAVAIVRDISNRAGS